jgi:uncharacterized protein (DUF2236 family)
MSDVQPKDDGLLGPDPVAWRVIGHPGALIGGLRSLILQSLHPLAMAGVDQHSDYVKRPLDRLHRTTYYVAATAYGDTETAERAVEHVRLRHRKVRGTDPVTGKPYSAEDPETQLWVHCTEWQSFLAAYRVFADRLTPEEEDRYIAEGAIIGSLLGTPREMVPASTAEMDAFFERVQPELRMSPAARAAIDFVVRPRPTRDILPYYVPLLVYGNAARALAPPAIQRLAGIERPPALDAAALAAARPWLTAAQLPLLHLLARRVVGRKTIDLIDSRLRPTTPDPAVELGLRQAA